MLPAIIKFCSDLILGRKQNPKLRTLREQIEFNNRELFNF